MALQTGYRETEPPRDDVTRQDRADVLLTEDEYPDGYELDRYEPGLSPTAPPDERRGFDPAACDALLEITPRFRPGNVGVSARATVPPGPHEDANWTSTDYVQQIVAESDADWDADQVAELVDDCETATANADGKTVTMTNRRLHLPHATGPDSVAVRTILEQGDGVVLHGAWAVERTAGQLIVLQAGTFGDFDEGQFIRLATAASRKVKDTLG